VPSSIIRNPARPDDDFKAQQKLEFDRWRTAIAIVERMRATLGDGVKTLVSHNRGSDSSTDCTRLCAECYSR
jgi:hypothetical protein